MTKNAWLAEGTENVCILSVPNRTVRTPQNAFEPQNVFLPMPSTVDGAWCQILMITSTWVFWAKLHVVDPKSTLQNNCASGNCSRDILHVLLYYSLIPNWIKYIIFLHIPHTITCKPFLFLFLQYMNKSMITTSFKLPNDCGNKRYSKGLRLTPKKILSKGCELLMYSRDINLGGKMGRLSFFWEDAKHVEGPYNRPPPPTPLTKCHRVNVGQMCGNISPKMRLQVCL